MKKSKPQTSNFKRVVKRFIDYVKIPSPSGKEEAFADYLCQEIKELGLKTYQDKIGNIYINIKGNNPCSNPILLNAHIDTVVHDTEIVPQIRSGTITSKGDTILGADNKAGVAVIMEVLNWIIENKIKHPDIQVIFTVQEEIGLKGAKQIVPGWIMPNIGYVLDGGAIDIIHNAAPSQINIHAEVIGRAAHAGVHPEEGISSIIVISEAISKMKLGRIDCETTANIGIIEGGAATNIIPEKAYIKGEARSHNVLKLKKQVLNMKNALKKTCRKYHAKLKLKIEKAYDSFYVGCKDEIIKHAESGMKKICIKPSLKITGGGSDANVFNKLGIKSIILGVGAGHVHTKNECIRIKDLQKSVRYLLEIIKSYA